MGLQSVGLPMQFIYLHLRNSFLMHFQNVPKASSCVNIRWHCRCCAIFFQFNVNLVHIKRYKFRHYQWAYNKNCEYIVGGQHSSNTQNDQHELEKQQKYIATHGFFINAGHEYRQHWNQLTFSDIHINGINHKCKRRHNINAQEHFEQYFEKPSHF